MVRISEHYAISALRQPEDQAKIRGILLYLLGENYGSCS